ncbi:hypothetical protein [Nostoc sp.]|uniref:hypothetical protein n=1 Tax=Nostoc sp. TaxID=1180 RepID=UPI002FF84247
MGLGIGKIVVDTPPLVGNYPVASSQSPVPSPLACIWINVILGLILKLAFADIDWR